MDNRFDQLNCIYSEDQLQELVRVFVAYMEVVGSAEFEHLVASGEVDMLLGRLLGRYSWLHYSIALNDFHFDLLMEHCLHEHTQEQLRRLRG